MHTLNYRGIPDTIYLDPSYLYNMKVHTIPAIYKKNISLVAGTHNTIAIDAAQGNLNLLIDGVTNYKNLQALVIEPKTNDIINIHNFNDNQKYLIGDYKLEILTLPRITQDVNVVQYKTTTVQVQQPGKLNVITRKKLEIGIFRVHQGEKELVKTLHITANQELTTLQPGTYSLIYRESAIKETLKTKEINFEIKAGEIHHININ
jgi:Ca-activated chloride channel family protein